jgi:NADPH:quinone reductase-like Zn-dependent oxidoreductase
MKALILNATLKPATDQEIPIPIPSPHELLVRVHYIALNPVDALYTFHPLGTTGRVVGSDFAGVVQATGADVPAGSSDIKPGSRVAGFLHGACSANDLPGAFAEYLVVPYDLVWRVPYSMILAQASTVSLCALTAAQGLFYRLGLLAPFARDDGCVEETMGAIPAEPIKVFVYGASTSVGLYAAQLVNLSFASSRRSLRLLGAASASRHERLEASPYSYNHLVDYRDADWPERIRRLCGESGGIDHAVDCISEGMSVERVGQTLAGGGKGKLAVFRSREGGAWRGDKVPVEVEPVYGAV